MWLFCIHPNDQTTNQVTHQITNRKTITLAERAWR